MLEANDMEFLRKIVSKTKIDRIRAANKSENPVVSNKLMNGGKE